ncbi:SGNH hydrolase, partial [Polyplosphaeria fusca]
MKLLCSVLLNSTLLLSLSPFVLAAPTTSTQHRRQDAEDQSWDQSWIRKWTAIGDSYSAGIGAGNRLDEACARYDQSYPSFIQNDPDMGDPANREFMYLSCSGAVSKEMLDKQIPNVPDGQDVITISAGGNDLQESDGLLDSALPASLDALYAAAKAKLAPGGTVYVTGYAQFWGNSEQCNGITWAFYQGLGYAQLNPLPAYLLIGWRGAMNRLVLKANQRIREAVERAGPQFVFVDYDEEYELIHGRFCEEEVVEDSPNRDNLLFYQWNTVDKTPDEPGRKRYDGEDPGTF